MLCMAFTAGYLASPSVGLSSDDATADCTTETYVASGHPGKIKFIVWCGVQSGDVSFGVKRSRDERIEGFKQELKAWGRGAVSPFRCSRRDDAIRCVGRKEGPVKVQGWITVGGERCAGKTILNFVGAYVLKPVGCPRVQPFHPHWNLRHLQNERQEFGFDADLNGDQLAITRRIQGLIRAWERGEPVARATAAIFGGPMRAREQREREYRSEYIAQLPEALDRWVPLFAQDTYAGYYVDHEHGGTIYIGFVGNQEAQLAGFMASSELVAPERLRPFPLPPKYSWAHLQGLQVELGLIAFFSAESDPWRMINRIGIDTAANVVEVYTEQVEEVRKLIDERFGPAAPILVVYGRPISGREGRKPKKPSASGMNLQGQTDRRGARVRADGACAGATEIDYEAPLADLPPLPRNTAGNGLGIGPPRLRLVPAGDRLNIEESEFGYELSVDRMTIRRPVNLDGYTEFELDRVDRAGRVVKPIAAKRQRLGVVAGPAFNGKPFLASVPAKPGLYRFQARLRDAQGRAVGRYADYLRVVRPVTDVRLVSSGGPLRPGSQINFWIENRGTREVDPLGAGFAFEVFEGGAWSKAPGSPLGFPKLKYRPLPAGRSGVCRSFRIPAGASPGLYRLSKDVVLESGARRQLTTEFEVSP
jgi:hypothetical protein